MSTTDEQPKTAVREGISSGELALARLQEEIKNPEALEHKLSVLAKTGKGMELGCYVLRNLHADRTLGEYCRWVTQSSSGIMVRNFVLYPDKYFIYEGLKESLLHSLKKPARPVRFSRRQFCIGGLIGVGAGANAGAMLSFHMPDGEYGKYIVEGALLGTIVSIGGMLYIQERNAEKPGHMTHHNCRAMSDDEIAYFAAQQAAIALDALLYPTPGLRRRLSLTGSVATDATIPR